MSVGLVVNEGVGLTVNTNFWRVVFLQPVVLFSAATQYVPPFTISALATVEPSVCALYQTGEPFATTTPESVVKFVSDVSPAHIVLFVGFVVNEGVGLTVTVTEPSTLLVHALACDA